MTRIAIALALITAACAAEPVPACYPEDGAYQVVEQGGRPGGLASCVDISMWTAGNITYLPHYEGREFEFDADTCSFTQVEPWSGAMLEAHSVGPYENDVYVGTITWDGGSCDVVLMPYRE